MSAQPRQQHLADIPVRAKAYEIAPQVVAERFVQGCRGQGRHRVRSPSWLSPTQKRTNYPSTRFRRASMQPGSAPSWPEGNRRTCSLFRCIVALRRRTRSFGLWRGRQILHLIWACRRAQASGREIARVGIGRADGELIEYVAEIRPRVEMLPRRAGADSSRAPRWSSTRRRRLRPGNSIFQLLEGGWPARRLHCQWRIARRRGNERARLTDCGNAEFINMYFVGPAEGNQRDPREELDLTNAAPSSETKGSYRAG